MTVRRAAPWVVLALVLFAFQGVGAGSEGPCEVEVSTNPVDASATCEQGPDAKVKVLWDEIAEGDSVKWCFTPRNETTEKYTTFTECTDTDINSAGKRTAGSSSNITVSLPEFAREEAKMNASGALGTQDCGSCIGVMLFVFKDPDKGGHAMLDLREPNTRGAGIRSWIGDQFSDGLLGPIVLGFLAGVVIVAVGIGLYLKARSNPGLGGARDKRSVKDGRGKQAVGKPGGTASFSSKPTPVKVDVRDPRPGKSVEGDVRITAPEGKKARKKQGEWVVPSPGAKAYKIQVEAARYKAKEVPVTSSNTLGNKLQVELEPKTGTIFVNARDASKDTPIGGLAFSVRMDGQEVTEGVTQWDRPTRVGDVPFGEYEVLIEVPTFLSVDGAGASPAARKARGVKRSVNVEPGHSVNARVDLTLELPELPLPADIQERLQQAMQNVRSYDTYIPRYLKQLAAGFGRRLRRGLAQNARTLVDEGLDEAALVSGVQAAQRELVDGLVESITSRSNLSLFAKTPTGGSPPDPVPLGVATPALIARPGQRKTVAQELRSTISELDEELTRLSRDLTIRPLADLLAVARRLTEDGVSHRQPVHGAAYLLAADLSLGSLKQAIEDEAFRPHLDGGGL